MAAPNSRRFYKNDGKSCVRIIRRRGFRGRGRRACARRALRYTGCSSEVGLGGTEAAQQAADELGIPLYVAHRREAFEQQVCAYFADCYRTARTPNPCVVCNPLVKFRALTDYADEIGAPYVATGTTPAPDGTRRGARSSARPRGKKDQTYMMHRLPRRTVARCLFPLGKARVRTKPALRARDIGLSVSEKPDSMDICFIPDGDVQGWLERHGAACPPGNFVDEAGNVLGRHKGLHCYTVGQRKGLGVAAAGRLFVHALRPEDRRGGAVARGRVRKGNQGARRTLHRARIRGKTARSPARCACAFRGAATARWFIRRPAARASCSRTWSARPQGGRARCFMTTIL